MPIGKGKPPQRGIAALWQTDRAKHAVDYVTELDLAIPDKPVDDSGHVLKPELPSDITKLGPEQLMKLYGNFAAVASYAEAQLGLMDVEWTDLDYDHDIVTAKVGLTQEGGNAEKRKFERLLDESVKQRKLKSLERRARKVLLEKLLNGYDRSMKTLSRELTRRGIELEGK